MMDMSSVPPMEGTSMKLMTLMNEGGWVMWALLLFSIAALAVAVERFVRLRRASLDFDAFAEQLGNALLRRQSVPEALQVARTAPGPVARVAGVALQRFDRAPNKIEQSMERQAMREERLLRRGMTLLATTATTAPLLGFLGTVTGMMASFHVLSESGISNPGMVALGIKEALTTTAAGLVVAVPTQIVYNVLQSRIERIQGHMEAVGNFLLETREELS